MPGMTPSQAAAFERAVENPKLPAVLRTECAWRLALADDAPVVSPRSQAAALLFLVRGMPARTE
jgi:hypothetical protein